MILQIQPFIDKRDIKTVSKYLATTWVTEGPATRDFETQFKEIAGTKHALAFCNGTMTLFTALKVLGIGKGDEVIVPSITFIATINSIILAGATPVVVDIDYNTLGIDIKQIRKNITKNTKAIMPVHLYGLAVDMNEINRIAKEFDLRVIEDAAQGVGVKFCGKHVGVFGDFGSFSFYGNKTITTGEGGMLVTNKKRFADFAYEMKNHGRLKKGVFKHEKIGFNFSISDLQSALGVSQLNKLSEIIKRKEFIYNFYKDNLSNLCGLDFYNIDRKISPVHWFTNILVKDAAVFTKKMQKQEVQTRRCFFPIKLQPCYKDYKEIRFSKNLSEDSRLYKNLVSLPSSVNISERELKKVVVAIKKSL